MGHWTWEAGKWSAFPSLGGAEKFVEIPQVSYVLLLGKIPSWSSFLMNLFIKILFSIQIIRTIEVIRCDLRLFVYNTCATEDVSISDDSNFYFKN